MFTRHFHGTRAELSVGDLIAPTAQAATGDAASPPVEVFLTPDLDGAIWSAELAPGEGPPRVYLVEPLGTIEPVSQAPPPHPAMSWRSHEPLRVKSEVTEWLYYHGTRADLRPGDVIEPGHVANFGRTARTANYVYFARTLDAATWGAELAAGEGRGRIYTVEPTGPFEDDPNLTNKRFRGNPTKSFRSRAPLRITGEIASWRGHAPQAIRAMREGLERLEQLGGASIDD